MCFRNKNYYEILGLNINCTSRDIKESYIKLSKQFHPDKNFSAGAHEEIIKINEAYSVLSKAAERKRYDSILKAKEYHNYSNNVHQVYRDNVGSTNASNESHFYPRYRTYYTHGYGFNMGTIKYNKAFLLGCLFLFLGSVLQVTNVASINKERHRKVILFLKEESKRSDWDRYEALINATYGGKVNNDDKDAVK